MNLRACILSSIPWFVHLIDVPDASDIFVYFVSYGKTESGQREQWAAPAGRAIGRRGLSGAWMLNSLGNFATNLLPF